jgi:ferredoxin
MQLTNPSAATDNCRYCLMCRHVCPVGHVVKPVMLIDRDLFNYDSVWAAAGHPHAVFNLTAAQLQEMTGGAVSDVRLDAPPTVA